MMPPITVFCPFTRLAVVDRWFSDLASSDLEPDKTNLALIIDTDVDPQLIYAKIKDNLNKTPYRKFVITRNNDHHVNEVNIPVRRKRIAEIHEQSKELISALDADYVLGLEDDTVFPNLSVERLYRKAQLDQVGLCSTYEAGRWAFKIIGIWNFDNIQEPTQCWTELPENGYEEVDATGFYCYLTKKSLYLEHTYSSETWQPWGPDVNYGLWLRQQGYTNFVDWEQGTGHYDDGIIIQPKGEIFSEHFILDKQPRFPNGYPQWVRRK